MSNCPTLIEPLAKSTATGSGVLPNLNYANQDFSSIKTRLVSFIQEKFSGNFNDFVEGSIAIMLMENVAFVGDLLSFKLDQYGNEIFSDTVSEVANMFRIAKAQGFTPTPPIAASAMFSAIIQSPLATDLIIPAGLQFQLSSNGGQLFYELFPADSSKNPIFDEDIFITSGNISNTSIVGLEGRTLSENFTSAGETNQTYTLTSSPVLYGSIRVDVDGQRWTLVEYFTDSSGRNEYRIEYDSNWVAYVIFGNGTAGRSPSSGSVVTVTYRVGGGTRGNIITGFINTQRGFSVPSFDFSVPVTFRNYTKGDHGYDGDTIDDIRRKLPAWTRTQDRAVTGEDYKTLAEQFSSVTNGQIGKAVAVLRNYGCAANVVDLFVLAKDGTDGLSEISDELEVELIEYIDTKKMITDSVCVRDGVVVFVDMTIDVTIDKFYKKFKEELNQKILNRINQFFLLPNWEFGQSLKESQIIRNLSMKEILDIDITFSTTNPNNGGTVVTVAYYEIIRPDTITINLTFE